MLFSKKFDLIFSLGEDCACSSYLRRFNLQEYSYPFDWLTNADFFTRMDLLVNDFKGFLEKENLAIIAYSHQKTINKHTDDYKDTKTDFYFYHDFDTKMPFDKSFILVKEKYQRRIKRLYHQIQKSQNILIVWWSRNKHQDIDKVKESYKLLSQKFADKDISILLIEFNKEQKQVFCQLNSWGGGLCFCSMIIFLLNIIQTTMKLWAMKQTTTPCLKISNARKSTKTLSNLPFFTHSNHSLISFH